MINTPSRRHSPTLICEDPAMDALFGGRRAGRSDSHVKSGPRLTNQFRHLLDMINIGRRVGELRAAAKSAD
jgi:hypothetical protein